MTNEQLLAEVEDLLRTMPPQSTIRNATPENFAWLGRFSAVIEKWNPTKGIMLGGYIESFHSLNAYTSKDGFRNMMTILHGAQHDLRMQTTGPTNIAFPNRAQFSYFDEIRKIIELARQDIFFVDPYLDADFVSKYLGHVVPGTSVRLLAGKKLATLLPAVEMFSQQHGTKIEVRSSQGLHDRYVLVDGSSCYQSGASFKDGAKSAPTTLTQITDAFPAVLKTYEDIWTQARESNGNRLGLSGRNDCVRATPN